MLLNYCGVSRALPENIQLPGGGGGGGASESLTVGRALSSPASAGHPRHACVSHKHLSRKHARFDLVAGGLQLSDIGATNGTYHNERRLGKNETVGPLKVGDTIRFGQESNQLTYRLVISGPRGAMSSSRCTAQPPPPP